MLISLILRTFQLGQNQKLSTANPECEVEDLNEAEGLDL